MARTTITITIDTPDTPDDTFRIYLESHLRHFEDVLRGNDMADPMITGDNGFHLKVDYPGDEAAADRILAKFADSHSPLLLAIKQYRAEFDCPLREAKAAIEAAQSRAANAWVK